jgi:RimJ/RimL family protein N-acetyltransferase
MHLKTDSRNERSQRAIERIGAKHEVVLRNHMNLPEGRFRHAVFYSILDTEWPEVKRKLEEMLLTT